jgi:hypothetical protein
MGSALVQEASKASYRQWVLWYGRGGMGFDLLASRRGAWGGKRVRPGGCSAYCHGVFCSIDARCSIGFFNRSLLIDEAPLGDGDVVSGSLNADLWAGS